MYDRLEGLGSGGGCSSGVVRDWLDVGRVTCFSGCSHVIAPDKTRLFNIFFFPSLLDSLVCL